MVESQPIFLSEMLHDAVLDLDSLHFDEGRGEVSFELNHVSGPYNPVRTFCGIGLFRQGIMKSLVSVSGVARIRLQADAGEVELYTTDVVESDHSLSIKGTNGTLNLEGSRRPIVVTKPGPIMNDREKRIFSLILIEISWTRLRPVVGNA